MDNAMDKITINCVAGGSTPYPAEHRATAEIYLDNLVIAEPRTSFSFEDASDLEYVNVTGNNGSVTLINKSERVTCDWGNPPDSSCVVDGTMDGKVLKVVGIGGGKGAGSIITVNLNQTVAAGSTVEFDIAITDMETKDACPTYVMVYVKDGEDWDSVQSYQYWHVCGVEKHVSLTLTNATDKIVFNCASGTLVGKGGNLSTAEIYLDNIVVTEP